MLTRKEKCMSGGGGPFLKEKAFVQLVGGVGRTKQREIPATEGATQRNRIGGGEGERSKGDVDNGNRLGRYNRLTQRNRGQWACLHGGSLEKIITATTRDNPMPLNGREGGARVRGKPPSNLAKIRGPSLKGEPKLMTGKGGREKARACVSGRVQRGDNRGESQPFHIGKSQPAEGKSGW